MYEIKIKNDNDKLTDIHDLPFEHFDLLDWTGLDSLIYMSTNVPELFLDLGMLIAHDVLEYRHPVEYLTYDPTSGSVFSSTDINPEDAGKIIKNVDLTFDGRYDPKDNRIQM